jgi:hypothetical protein
MEGLELAVSKLIQLKDVSKSGIAVGDVLTVLTTNPYTFGWSTGGGGALGSDSFTTVAGTSTYTRTALNGKTIVLLFYGQVLSDPSLYTLVGDQLTFTYPPDDAYNIVIIYQ